MMALDPSTLHVQPRILLRTDIRMIKPKQPHAHTHTHEQGLTHKKDVNIYSPLFSSLHVNAHYTAFISSLHPSTHLAY